MGDHLGSPVDNEGRAGFLFGKSSSKGDDMVVSPGPDDQTFGGRASFSRGGGGGGGVKRTKSLMQKIKSMVRRESESDMPPTPAVAAGSRSQSMSAADGYTRDPRRPSIGGRGGWRDAQVMEEEEEEERMDTGEWSPPRAAQYDSRGTPVSVAGRY